MIHRGLGPYAFVANPSRTFSYLAPTLLFLCMAAGHSLFAQAISGSIGETVTDTTGDVIPGATVTVTDVNKPTENPQGATAINANGSNHGSSIGSPSTGFRP